MKERPILFSGPMVRAILEGRKTQTRRVVRWPAIPARHDPDYDAHVIVDGWPWFFVHPGDGMNLEQKLACPYGVPGDRLWVKETHCWENDEYVARHKAAPWLGGPDPDTAEVFYRASERNPEIFGRWRPSIFMPRWASRITLQVVSVRVERLNKISEGDAAAEGVTPIGYDVEFAGGSAELWGPAVPQVGSIIRPGGTVTAVRPKYVAAYRELWDELNGCRGCISWGANPWVWVVEFRRIGGAA